MELEQIAVDNRNQNTGVATKLIEKSLQSIKDYLSDIDSVLKTVIVSTRTDNKAQALYRKVLGAEPIAVIKDLYSADEVIMKADGL